MDIFRSTILNILSNFTPHEMIICNDRDLPWFNKIIKGLIQEKNTIFKHYRKSSSNIDLNSRLKHLKICLNRRFK